MTLMGEHPDVYPAAMVEELERELAAARQAIRELYACVVHGADGHGPHDFQRDEYDQVIVEHRETLQVVDGETERTLVEVGKVFPVDSYIVDRDARAAAMRAVAEVPA